MTDFNYINSIPKIPEDLEMYVYESTKGRDLFHKPNDIYKIYNANANIIDYLKTYFDPRIYNIRIQVLNKDTEIHKDVNRIKVFNYIIQSGGSNVLTCFYNDDRELTNSIKIEEKEWHSFRVDINHAAINIIKPRIAITVHIPLKK